LQFFLTNSVKSSQYLEKIFGADSPYLLFKRAAMETESISANILSPSRGAVSVRDRASASRSISARIISEISPQEMVMLFFAAIFVAIAMIAHERVTLWPRVLFVMAAAAFVIALVNLWSSGSPVRSLGAFKTFYIAPLIPVFFKTAELISFPLHGRDYDSALIAADRMIFGVNPTQWIAQHIGTIVPVRLLSSLTEYMMFCYSLFFFLPTAVAIELFLKARKKERNGIHAEERGKVDKIFFIVAYGFLLSYAAYFLFPAVGPRFTLHNFLDISTDLPGVLFTDTIRSALDRGENILKGMSLAEALHAVTRDAFPSGHADITLITIILAFEFRAKIRYIVAILGASLIFATVYLRYHYVVDLIGGAILAMITLYTWQWLRDRMIGLKTRLGG
jgi:membrane-associated phospholipid phosphatase